MAERIEQIRMPNGVRVVLEQMPYVKTAAFGVFVAVGSVDETKENNGISHMIEHMMFKGTETYSAKALADRMAVLGDTVNAYTGKEYTAYYGVTVAEELPSLMELLSDMLFHSVFSKDTLAKEKSVVLEEIDMYNDSPDDLVHELCDVRRLLAQDLYLQTLLQRLRSDTCRVEGLQYGDDLLYLLFLHVDVAPDGNLVT